MNQHRPDPYSTHSEAAAGEHRPPATEAPAAKRSRISADARRWWLRLAVQPLLFLAAGLVLIAALGLTQRFGWFNGGSPTVSDEESVSSKPTEYICPMMCTPPLQAPGRCPVCAMELVPASSADDGGDGRSIVVDAAARRIANIKTAEVRALPMDRRIRAIGKLSYDESGLKTLTAYVDGRLDRLFADYTGVKVNRGDRLAVLYSPELYSAQVEYLAARGETSSAALPAIARANRSLAENARQRLIELGMQPRQIDELVSSGEAKTRLDLYAEITGTVIEKLAAEGDYVDRGEPIYRLADLSRLWLMLELFPEEAADIRYGQRVEAEVQSLPGETFVGRVAFIDPSVDPKTRTVGVRVVIPNPAGRLRVGDYVTADVEVPLGRSGRSAEQIYDPELAGKWISPRHPHVVSDSPGRCRLCGIEMIPAEQLGFTDQPIDQRDALVVPRRSVLRAGDTSVVYVETEPGRFEGRRVVLGPTVEDRVVIREGLRAGESVATSGNFLIDSQMQLASNPSLIDPARFQPPEKAGSEMSPAVLAALDELGEERRAAAVEQRICPVTELPLGSMGTPEVADVDGRRVFLCCEDCRDRLLNSPAEYLANLEAAESREASSDDPSSAATSGAGASEVMDLPPILPPRKMDEEPDQ